MKNAGVLGIVLCFSAALAASVWVYPWDAREQDAVRTQLAARVADPLGKLKVMQTRLTEAYGRLGDNVDPQDVALYHEALSRIEAAREACRDEEDTPQAHEEFSKAWYASRGAFVQFRTVEERARGRGLRVDIDAVLRRIDAAKDSINKLDPTKLTGMHTPEYDAQAEAQAMREAVQARFKSLENEQITVERDKRGTVISVSDMLFEVGKSALTGKLKPNLARVADILAVNPNAHITIEGHTDNRGDKSRNQRLSEQRAANVKQFLITQGVDSTRIIARGYGFKRPIAPNDTEEGRRKNRRVELVIGVAEAAGK